MRNRYPIFIYAKKRSLKYFDTFAFRTFGNFCKAGQLQTRFSYCDRKAYEGGNMFLIRYIYLLATSYHQFIDGFLFRRGGKITLDEDNKRDDS